MIMIITLILSFLVALNFLLLIFSCNKTTKRIPSESPTLLKSSHTAKTTAVVTPSVPTKKIPAQTQLAPTGS